LNKGFRVELPQCECDCDEHENLLGVANLKNGQELEKKNGKAKVTIDTRLLGWNDFPGDMHCVIVGSQTCEIEPLVVSLEEYDRASIGLDLAPLPEMCVDCAFAL